MAAYPFIYPPTVSTQLPAGTEIPENHIVLFKDDKWDSESFTIDLDSAEYPIGTKFGYPDFDDCVTWIAFNLPDGVVCTLYTDIPDNPGSAADFKDCGVCVDLIGNGTVQTIDLGAYDAFDCLSGGVWRTVQKDQGWVQLFRDWEDKKCSGQFITLFSTEWPTGGVNSLAGWWLKDKASSVNLPCLTPAQQVTFYQNDDGPGLSGTYGAVNPFGTSASPAEFGLGSKSLSDAVSAFKFEYIPPISVVIDSVKVGTVAQVLSGSSFTDTYHVTNDTDEPITKTFRFEIDKEQEISNTATQEYGTSTTITASVSASSGVPDVNGVKVELSTSFTFSTSTSSSRTTTNSQTTDLSQEVTFTAQPRAITTAIASLDLGTLPSTPVSTHGRFYYAAHLPGSVKQTEGQFKGLYLLEVPIDVEIAGGVGSQMDIVATAIPIHSVGPHTVDSATT